MPDAPRVDRRSLAKLLESPDQSLLDLVDSLKAPVLGLYGGADQGIPNADVEKMQAALKTAKKPSEIVLYDGMPHGFHADYRPSYREAAAKDGWQRLRTWFQQNGAA